MVKPYREDTRWAVRLRVRGHNLYLSGFSSEAVARREAERQRAAIVQTGAPAHGGPTRTTLGHAFALYARERLPYLKSGDKDANRLNAYLRACALPVIELVKVEGEVQSGPRAYWVVRFVDESERRIVRSLSTHRSALAEKHKNTERVRSRLARMCVSDITPVRIAELLEVMANDGYKQANRSTRLSSRSRPSSELLMLIRTIHQEIRQAYGARRIHAELRGLGYRIGLPRIERLMRENGIRGRHKRRYKATTDSRHNLPVAANVLDRQFVADAPNRVWTGDITYIATAEGWLYRQQLDRESDSADRARPQELVVCRLASCRPAS